jgi:hypothetical protein
MEAGAWVMARAATARLRLRCAFEDQASPNTVHLMGFRALSGNGFQGDPLTRPAPADEDAGCGPPSPPRGRGKWIQITSPLAPLGERGRG